MKLKSFSAGELDVLDKQVNEWVAANKVVVKSVTITPGQISFPMKSQPSGKTTERQAAVFCAAVWYEPSN